MKHFYTPLFFSLLLLVFHSQASDVGSPDHLSVESSRIYLSGEGADDAIDWDFKLEHGRGAGEWTTIPVPSCWELQGFGQYEYLEASQNRGFYKTTFDRPENSGGQRILLFFEGVLCQTEVRVNGQSAGPAHQGGFYRFSYDITELVKPTGNLLEVTVQKVADNAELDKAHRGDYWSFSGIFRPVYLKTVPQEYVDWFAVHGDMDGSFLVDVYAKHLKESGVVRATVTDLEGNAMGASIETEIIKGENKVSLRGHFDDVKLWSDEFPHLYRVEVELCQGEAVVHRVSDRFGFRRFENRPGQGFFLNGNRVILKGAARHCFWPDTGRTLSLAIDREDVLLIKNTLNMNFVRCVHYPPDESFLDLCDEIGLLATSELNGWVSKMPTEPGRALVKALVSKDVNHPSVVQWHNGNHRGCNDELLEDYATWDPQKRMVIRNEGQTFPTVPGVEHFGDQAIDSRYYPNYSMIEERLAPGKVNTVQPHETLHALYDGGGGAALHDYYRALRSSDVGGGITIWALVDECVVRTDQNDVLDGSGNRAPDGIVGPFRELEGSAYACREIFSPIQFLNDSLPIDFDGQLSVANEFTSTSLEHIEFQWKLVKFPQPFELELHGSVVASGTVDGPKVLAGEQGVLDLKLSDVSEDAEALELCAVHTSGTKIISKTWMLKSRADMLDQAFPKTEDRLISGDGFQINSGDAVFEFDEHNGLLSAVKVGEKQPMTFQNGPSFVWSVSTGEEVENNEASIDAVALKALGQKVTAAPKDEFDSPWSVQSLDMSDWVATASTQNGHPVIESKDPAGKGFFRWTVLGDGGLQLDYSYDLPRGLYGYAGIAFDLEESVIKSKRWLGAGPSRVWKNRLHGPKIGLWKNDYNDGIPGEVWELPAFKGNFKDVCWASFQMEMGQIAIGLADTDAYLGVQRPQNGRVPKRALWSYPAEGGLFVFNAISPVGAKWRDSREAGPSSGSNQLHGPIEGTIYFRVVE